MIETLAEWGNIRRSTKTAHQRLITARTISPRCPSKSWPPGPQFNRDVRFRCRILSKVYRYLRRWLRSWRRKRKRTVWTTEAKEVPSASGNTSNPDGLIARGLLLAAAGDRAIDEFWIHLTDLLEAETQPIRRRVPALKFSTNTSAFAICARERLRPPGIAPSIQPTFFLARMRTKHDAREFV